MTRFNQTKLNSMTSTVDVGAGLIWDQVYKTLEPTGVNVIGGRISGIGVAGFTLGGGECLHRQRTRSHILLGYLFLSSQYGLTLDNVVGYELVLPNGTVANVTSEDDDLWFGLRVSRQV
jgi:FAD/FMN-containing dehydrogenase